MWLAALVPDIVGLGKLQKIPILYNTPYSFSIFLSLKTKYFNSTSQLIMDKAIWESWDEGQFWVSGVWGY